MLKMRALRLARLVTCLSTSLLCSIAILAVLCIRSLLDVSSVQYQLLITYPKSSHRIVLTNLSNLFVDVHKTATYYPRDHTLIMTFLAQTELKRTRKFAVNLRVRHNGRVLLDERVTNVFENMPCSTAHYVFAILKRPLVLDLVPVGAFANSTTKSSRLTYQLTANNLVTQEFDINIVNHYQSHESLASLRGGRTARLIKCMWMPKDAQYFEFVMRLIIQSRYDSIYICVFSQDLKLKAVLEKLKIEESENKQKQPGETRTNIVIVELDALPHYSSSKPFFLDYDELRYDRQIANDSGILDAAMEFLLNQMYPGLIEKYAYVQAADYDHILFAHKRSSFYDRIETIVNKLDIRPPHASLYLNQYWALDNRLALNIFDFITDRLRMDTALWQKLETDGWPLPAKTMVVDVESFRFLLAIRSKSEWEHMRRLLRAVNESRASWATSSSRQVVFMMAQRNVFGQTIHNTRSSLVVKLCGAGEFFRHGVQHTVYSHHFLHYRESFKLDMLGDGAAAAAGSRSHLRQAASINVFALWEDFVANEI